MRGRCLLLVCLLLASCGAATEQARAPISTPPSPAPGRALTPTPGAAEATAPGTTESPALSATTMPGATESPAPTATTTPPAAAPPPIPSSPTPAVVAAPVWGYPIGLPGRVPGDGFFIRHGYTVENTWFNPGDWHTGEDWYAQTGDTAGAQVLAVADGTVVYAGANYPGRVVIVQHAADLYSMYGHLDPALAVQVGQQVSRGALLGTVLRRGDDVPNHLHVELRTFLTTLEVNGSRPRYGYRCGPDCPPGPGYWPIAAPELPDALGWRNPTHVINRRMLPELDGGGRGEVLVASDPVSDSVTLWGEFADDGRPQDMLAEIALEPGARYPLLNVRAGAEAPQATSGAAYQLWYRIELPDARTGWVQAAVPTTFETGSDGRPSTVQFNLLPAGMNASR